jgi:hypothetical protein
VTNSPGPHKGGCHCGNVRYSVEIAAFEPVISCNCSMCQKRGSLLTFVPADSFTLEKGADALTEYLFNKHVIHHKFCSTCGILPFAEGKGPDGKAMVAINVRCLDDIDLKSLNVTEFDGRNA